MDKVERALDEAAKGRGGNKASATIIDHYLAAVRQLGDATPSDDDLRISKRYLDLLTAQTAVDHLKSVDELLVQNPLEFSAAKKELHENESFIYLCASGRVDAIIKALDKSWNKVSKIAP
jgi:predicted alpha-1,6-mannanase (GH76 family)